MKLLAPVIALLALTASAPAFASDYSTDRYFTQRNAATAPAPEARPAAPQAQKDVRPCDCACSRRTAGPAPATSRVEPGRH